ncbi:MAG: winged helix-turn-helix domain-containing protein [Chloroflexi bacterium]|nr:winged helix-turn-helix domain-containing protein [Chloroflexota bacterium]
MLLVLEGQRPGQVTRVLGLNHMALERSIHAVNRGGPQALVPKPRPGRPARLTMDVQRQLELDLQKNPQEFGLSRPSWDGPTVATYLKERFGVRVRVRQAQRWMHKLGYGLKRASYTYIQARAEDALNDLPLRGVLLLKDDEAIRDPMSGPELGSGLRRPPAPNAVYGLRTSRKIELPRSWQKLVK